MVAIAPSRPRRARKPVQSFGALRYVDHAEGMAIQRQAGHASTDVIECPCCHTPVLRSAVVSDDRPMFVKEHGQHAFLDRAYCHHCDQIFAWLEASNAGGTRRGLVLGEPAFIKDSAIIEKFLAAHPEAAGVMQSTVISMKNQLASVRG